MIIIVVSTKCGVIEVHLTMQVDQMLWMVTAIILSSYRKLMNDFRDFNSL